MHWVQVVAIGILLTGCAAAGGGGGGGGGGQMTWMRADGRPVDGGFKAAADQCRNVATRVGSGAPRREREETMMAAMQSCMQQRGYVWRCDNPLAVGGCSDGDTGPDSPPKPPRSGAPGQATI